MNKNVTVPLGRAAITQRVSHSAMELKFPLSEKALGKLDPVPPFRRCSDVADARSLQLRDLCAEDQRGRSRFRHLRSICATTPLGRIQAADQGFRHDHALDGVMAAHPSDTPHSTFSAAPADASAIGMPDLCGVSPQY